MFFLELSIIIIIIIMDFYCNTIFLYIQLSSENCLNILIRGTNCCNIELWNGTGGFSVQKSERFSSFSGSPYKFTSSSSYRAKQHSAKIKKKKKKDFNPVQKKDAKVTNPIKGDLSAKHNPMKPIHATPLSDIHRERGLSGGPSCSSTNPRKILSLQNPHK